MLRVKDIPRPSPDVGEVLLEIGAAGINPVDTYFQDGSYEPISVPFTPGVDISGRIVECGPDVTQFEAGEQVFGTGIRNGSYQRACAADGSPVSKDVREDPAQSRLAALESYDEQVEISGRTAS